MKVADLNVITCTSFTLACRTWNSSTTPQSNAIGCDHCQQPWMAGSQRGSIASQHLELRPGSWYDNELCRLLFMHHVTCKTPSLPKPNPRRRRPRWLIMTGDGGLCASRQKPGTTAEAHVVPPENNELHLRRGTRRAVNIVIMMRREQMKNEIFLLSHRGRRRTHDWLPGERDLPHKLAAQTLKHHDFHICTTPLHSCSRGVLFSSWSRKDEDRRCLPSWKRIPHRNPRHETNKHPPHDTLAIHSHLHGYVGCCQNSLSVQC